MGANALDSLIGWLSPATGFRRLRARKAFETLRGGYEGASSGRRTEGWTAGNGSANAALAGSLPKLRARSRDLTRNNPYAEKALSVIVTNTVGAGITPAFRSTTRKANRAEALAEVWKAWGETTDCDADGLHDFYGIEALVLRTIAESGECLIRRRWRRASDGLALPFQLQVLEPDFIDTSKDTAAPDKDGRETVQGIQFDALGRRTGYWLYSRHPGDNAVWGRTESRLVPAEDIIHVYRVRRPGQVRGVPWPAPVIMRLRDFDEFEDAQLIRQKIAACFAAFVTDTEGGAVAPDGKPKAISDSIEPGIMEVLPPGKSIAFADPPGVTGYDEYTTTMLRGVAAGYGITYEALTGDLSGVNFSSGRMGWLEFQRNIDEWRWLMLIPRLCGGVWAWFAEAAALSGLNTEGVRAEWSPPRREMIDPVQETKATVNAIRAGLQSLPEAIRQQGYDPDAVFREIAETNKLLDDLGLVFESDARKITQAGQLQTEISGAANDNNPKKEKVSGAA